MTLLLVKSDCSLAGNNLPYPKTHGLFGRRCDLDKAWVAAFWTPCKVPWTH